MAAGATPSTWFASWPWRCVLEDQRIEVLRPRWEPRWLANTSWVETELVGDGAHPQSVPLEGVRYIVVRLGSFGSPALLTLLDDEARIIGQVGQCWFSFTPRFLSALSKATGCRVMYAESDYRPGATGGP